MDEIMQRLAAQDRMLSAILAALAPPAEETGAGLDDLVQALNDLTTAVEMQGAEIRDLRSAVSAGYPSSMVGPSRAA